MSKSSAVADKDEGAPGLVLAQDLGLMVTTSYRELLAAKVPDLIIDVTGDPQVGRDISALKPAESEVVGGNTARFIWELY